MPNSAYTSNQFASVTQTPASISSPGGSYRKRSTASSPATSTSEHFEPRRKAYKVSRACDLCKAKKAKCTGTKPCDSCVKKCVPCVYDAKYSRGRPPTPPPSMYFLEQQSNSDKETQSTIYTSIEEQTASNPTLAPQHNIRHRQPSFDVDHDMAEQDDDDQEYHDPTSGFSFIHRAWKRLSSQSRHLAPELNGAGFMQPWLATGDLPFEPRQGSYLPDRSTGVQLIKKYFVDCAITLRFLHRSSTLAWHDAVQENANLGRCLSHGLGSSKAGVVLTVLAIAIVRQEKIHCAGRFGTETTFTRRGDQLFCAAARLTELESGVPKLESAQMRLVQAMYLLSTSRMNQGWYVIGSTIQLVSALGLHRKPTKIRTSSSKSAYETYINAEGRKRTFWVLYIMDKYLAVVFGRPSHFDDEDIDQDFPGRLNEDNTTCGAEEQDDIYMDALVYHAQLARIVGIISKEVYSIKATRQSERIAAAHRANQQLRRWSANLPPYFALVNPINRSAMYSKQATILKLAYSHALIHANRSFLLDNYNLHGPEGLFVKQNIEDCVLGAKMTLDIIDNANVNDVVFHGIWWSSYVTFCALSVVYVVEIQQSSYSESPNFESNKIDLTHLLEPAERCRFILLHSSNSPSQKYITFLEELRMEASLRSIENSANGSPTYVQEYMNPSPSEFDLASMMPHRPHDYNMMHQGFSMADAYPKIEPDANLFAMAQPFNHWRPSDWNELCSGCPMWNDFSCSRN